MRRSGAACPRSLRFELDEQREPVQCGHPRYRFEARLSGKAAARRFAVAGYVRRVPPRRDGAARASGRHGGEAVRWSLWRCAPSFCAFERHLQGFA